MNGTTAQSWTSPLGHSARYSWGMVRDGMESKEFTAITEEPPVFSDWNGQLAGRNEP